MDIWALIVGLGVIVGIVAGIFQVLDYLQKQRKKKHVPTTKDVVISPSPVPAIPSNLPPRGEFIGREKEKARAQEALASRWPLICIDGIGGIGKTVLALEVAAECLQASRGEIQANGISAFGGFIWTSAKDRGLTLNDVLDTIARTLDYPVFVQQPLEEKRESVRKLLQSKRCLLIVDNFETVTDDALRDFLLWLPEPSKALITSREQRLRQAWTVSLKGLEREEAFALMRSEGRRLGLASVKKGEERVLVHLYNATGGAPLAIKWAVSQIKQKGQSLDTVLNYLYEAQGDVFENIFARSWVLLSEDAKRVLMVMPIFVTSASKPAIEAASDVHKWDLDDALGQLVQMWLVEASDDLEQAKIRYDVHPLTRAFAARKLMEGGLSLDVRTRLLHHFVQYVRHCDGLVRRSAIYDELEQEKYNILALVQWSCQEGKKESSRRCLWNLIGECARAVALNDFLWTRGYWIEMINVNELAVEVGKVLLDWETLSLAAFHVGYVWYWRNEVDMAQFWAQESIAAAKQSSNPLSLPSAKRLQGLVFASKGYYQEAEQLLLEALQATSQPIGIDGAAAIKGELGQLMYERADYEAARLWTSESLQISRDHGDIEGQIISLTDLARAAHALGDLHEAEALYMQALELTQDIRCLREIARCQLGLSRIAEQQGRLADARRKATLANELFQRLGMNGERLGEREVGQAQEIIQRLESNPSV